MAGRDHFYIPPRLYKMMKCIYDERIIVVAAPEGYGKSGLLREFVRRSRPVGYSCRFITGAANANDCFARICMILLGHEEPIPTSAPDFNRLAQLFSAAKPEKELVMILDCPGAEDMLLGNLYCTWLFLRHSPIHLTLIASELSYFNKMLVDSCSIPTISDTDLALTCEEAQELFRWYDTDISDINDIYKSSGGQFAKLRLFQVLVKRGESISSYNMEDLLHHALIKPLDRSQLFAAMCASSLEKMDDVILAQLNADPLLVDYFGHEAMTRAAIFSGIRYISSIIPVIELDERSQSWRSRIFFKRATYKAFLELPKEIQVTLHRHSAQEYYRNGKTFRAFSQYYLAGDLISAAMMPNNERVSFELLMRSKDFLLNFAENCPLDCKPIIPRLLRILGLLMLTTERDRISYRFDEIISHITHSNAYTRRERRNMLCYAHAVRTYENFYFIEKMGNNIKMAYELYSGTSIGTPPFYTWALYTPSVFCLIHRYELPISTEAEQFSRYHSMYTEMIHHGEHVVSLYNAEICYYTGDLENALIRAQDVAEKCSRELYLPTKISALNAIGKSALLLGNYDLFMRALNELAEIKQRYSTTELSEMTSLCLARLCCMRKGTDEDIWEISSKRNEEVMLNRYTAPFYFHIRCYAMLSHREYRMLLSKVDNYISISNEVRNETMTLCHKMTTAAAHLILGESNDTLRLMAEVLEVLDGSGVIMPAVELCMLHPQLFEFALQNLPKKHHRFLKSVLSMGKVCRRNMEAVRTRELTETGGMTQHTESISAHIDSLLDEKDAQRRELGLTPSAMRYAICAACGYPNEKIAEICDTSVNSVKSSLKRTFAKLGIRSRGQLKYLFDI